MMKYTILKLDYKNDEQSRGAFTHISALLVDEETLYDYFEGEILLPYSPSDDEIELDENTVSIFKKFGELCKDSVIVMYSCKLREFAFFACAEKFGVNWENNIVTVYSLAIKNLSGHVDDFRLDNLLNHYQIESGFTNFAQLRALGLLFFRLQDEE